MASAAYEPAFRFFAEWWKQLFGESEGKSGKGVFPASVDLTPDLHSMGEYMQQGLRNVTGDGRLLRSGARACRDPDRSLDNLDGLNYLAGKTMDYVNEVAMKATKKAHIDGGVPVTEIRVERICEETVGALIYFFEFACGVSGYISGVNPFNQPGVEAYKTRHVRDAWQARLRKEIRNQTQRPGRMTGARFYSAGSHLQGGHIGPCAGIYWDSLHSLEVPT